MARQNNSGKNLPKVCVIGGGNASHVLAAWLPSRGYETFWFASFEDEAERLNSITGNIQVNFDTTITETTANHPSTEAQGVSVEGPPHSQPHGIVEGRPARISKNAAEVIPSSDVLIAPIPSFAYESVLSEIKPFLRSGQFLGVTPGQGGFDWVAKETLGEKLYNEINIFSLLPMPLNCRITEFGKAVHVTALKQNFKLACNHSKSPSAESSREKKELCELVREMFDAVHVDHVGLILSATLYPINAVLHPARNFCLAGKDFVKGKDVLKSNPLFYEDMDNKSIDTIATVSKELQQVAAQLTAETRSRLNVDVPTILSFLQYVYGQGFKTLRDMFTQNPAYKGYRCPLTRVQEDGWEPDFTDRYFTEDIPLGLCVVKGLAELASVDTPTIDSILYWAQRNMGKEYLVNGKLSGRNIGETNAPQRFGINSTDELVSFYS